MVKTAKEILTQRLSFHKNITKKKILSSTNSLTLSPGVTEDYRKLSENISTLKLTKSIKTIAVSSSVHGEGCSTVAVNLAITLAKKGVSNILLIDGNLRKPSLHEFFRLEKEKGLTEVIREEIDLAEVLKESPVSNLLLMTSGDIEIDPNQIFSSRRFQEFVTTIGNQFELVLFDSPPINLYPDSAILSPLLDNVLMVIQAERVIYEKIQKAKEKIESSGGRILGAVLNRRRYYIPDMIYRRL